jgi:hypothetical protein
MECERHAREETHVRDGVKHQHQLEDRIKGLENDSIKLRQLVKSVNEQSQIVRKIALIQQRTNPLAGLWILMISSRLVIVYIQRLNDSASHREYLGDIKTEHRVLLYVFCFIFSFFFFPLHLLLLIPQHRYCCAPFLIA